MLDEDSVVLCVRMYEAASNRPGNITGAVRGIAALVMYLVGESSDDWRK